MSNDDFGDVHRGRRDQIRPLMTIYGECSAFTWTMIILLMSNSLLRATDALNVRRQTNAAVASSIISHRNNARALVMSPHLDSNEYDTPSLSINDTSSSRDNTIGDTFIPMDTPARQSLLPHLSLRPIPGKGLGVISLKSISIGEVVGEYKGEVMSQEVKDRRYLPSLADQQTEDDRKWIQSRRERGQTISGCYLYGISVPAKRGAATTATTTLFIDAEDEYESLWTRFLNHAPLPYGNIHPKSIHESYDGKPRVWFVANRNIDVGEEICFDYGDDYWLDGDDVV
jgi:hypothetical protein